jgi:hypothetical protein
MRRVDLIICSLFLREEVHGKRVLVLQSSLALLKRALQPFDLPGPHGVRFNFGDIGKNRHSRNADPFASFGSVDKLEPP